MGPPPAYSVYYSLTLSRDTIIVSYTTYAADDPLFVELRCPLKFILSNSSTFLIHVNHRYFVTMEPSPPFVNILLLSCVADHVLKQNRIARLLPVEI